MQSMSNFLSDQSSLPCLRISTNPRWMERTLRRISRRESDDAFSKSMLSPAQSSRSFGQISKAWFRRTTKRLRQRIRRRLLRLPVYPSPSILVNRRGERVRDINRLDGMGDPCWTFAIKRRLSRQRRDGRDRTTAAAPRCTAAHHLPRFSVITGRAPGRTRRSSPALLTKSGHENKTGT